MENKYYTPKIEEFRVGFEYEAKYTKEGWQRETFGVKQTDIHSIPQLLHSFLKGADYDSHIRVKHLDEEDILSLGWERKGNVYFIGDENNDTYSELYEAAYRKWEISRNDLSGVDNDNRHFSVSSFASSIIIRNKSELKVLMAQLGIT